MQLSEKTLSVLKNFSMINPSVVIYPGNVIRTISQQKSILATATVDEEFTETSGIYDLSRFLATLSLFENPDVEFTNKIISISEGKRNVNYTLAEPTMIIQPPQKEVTMPNSEVEVDVNWNNIQSVLKAASVLSLPEISFSGRDGEIHLEAINPKNPTSDKYGVVIGETEDTFNMFIKVDNLKLMQRDYTVRLSSKGLSSFVSSDVSYFVAIEASHSKFGV